MWPWEHLAVGYLCYSLWHHWRTGTAPRGVPVVALVVATQLADLVDKPLAWWLGVLPSGHSLGHSLVFTASVVVLAWLVAGRRLAAPLTIGQVTHLVGDMIFPAMVGKGVRFRFLLWPFVEMPASETEGLLLRADELFAEFLEFLASPSGVLYLGFEVALLSTVFVLWVYDGLPGLAPSSFRSDDELAADS